MHQVSDEAGLQVWAKPLAQAGSRAVVLLNRTDSSALMSVSWDQLGIASQAAEVHDVWTHQDFRARVKSYQSTVPAHEAALIVVQGSEGRGSRYTPHIHLNDVVFDHVVASGAMSSVRIEYTNRNTEAWVMTLRVNGTFPTRVAFPPTKSGAIGAIMIEAELETKNNVLTFSPNST